RLRAPARLRPPRARLCAVDPPGRRRGTPRTPGLDPGGDRRRSSFPAFAFRLALRLALLAAATAARRVLAGRPRAADGGTGPARSGGAGDARDGLEGSAGRRLDRPA